MSKKLATAIAQGKVVVRNKISGEISLMIEGEIYVISSGDTFNITALTTPARIAKMTKLRELLGKKHLELV